MNTMAFVFACRLALSAAAHADLPAAAPAALNDGTEPQHTAKSSDGTATVPSHSLGNQLRESWEAFHDACEKSQGTFTVVMAIFGGLGALWQKTRRSKEQVRSIGRVWDVVSDANSCFSENEGLKIGASAAVGVPIKAPPSPAAPSSQPSPPASPSTTSPPGPLRQPSQSELASIVAQSWQSWAFTRQLAITLARQVAEVDPLSPEELEKKILAYSVGKTVADELRKSNAGLPSLRWWQKCLPWNWF